LAHNLGDLVRGMNALTEEPRLDPVKFEREIAARDQEITNTPSADAQSWPLVRPDTTSAIG
jgi:predicted oxidoreductase